MYYSNMVKLACNIVYEATKDTYDKGGYPYFTHPFYLASKMDDEDTCITALLHDLIEDHSDKYSFSDLKKLGFNDNVIDALRLLTHDEAVPYLEYVKAIKPNAIARRVKIEDLKHNMDIRRTNGVYPHKYEFYKEALAYLEN